MRQLGVLFFLMFTACGGAEVDFARSLAVPAPADLILRNGKIVTVDREFSIKRAVAIRGGRFVAVGGDRDVRVLAGPSTQVIDLDGRTVIPGLVDGHIHATVGGLSWDATVHWQNLDSLAQALGQVASAAQARAQGTWIVVGGGWVPTQFAERRFPTRADLDRAAPNHPVYVQYLRQGALLNSAALKAAGIGPATPDPAGGKIERNPATGETTGWLQGTAAWDLARRKIPAPPFDRLRQSLKNSFRELNRLGVTSVSDLQTDEVLFTHRRLLADLSRTGELGVRLHFFVDLDLGNAEEHIKRTVEEISRLQQSDLFRFAGFTLRLGGDVDVFDASAGALLDAESKERLRRALGRLILRGDHIRVLAPGDAGVREAIALLEEVHKGPPVPYQRMGFAHLEDASAETLERIKRIGGAVTITSRLALTAERYLDRRGAEQARNAPPLRRIIESAIPAGAGSGAYESAHYSPMLSLWWLITGKTVAGSAVRGLHQNLSRADALRLHTLGAASLTASDAGKGSIEVDKLADLAVLSGDYLTVPEERIPSLESLLTIVGGRIVYAADPFARYQR